METKIGRVLSSYMTINGLRFKVETLGETFLYDCWIHVDNEIAVRIAYKKLSDLVLACGKNEIQDPNELNGIDILCDIGDSRDGRQIKAVRPIVLELTKPLSYAATRRRVYPDAIGRFGLLMIISGLVTALECIYMLNGPDTPWLTIILMFGGMVMVWGGIALMTRKARQRAREEDEE